MKKGMIFVFITLGTLMLAPAVAQVDSGPSEGSRTKPKKPAPPPLPKTCTPDSLNKVCVYDKDGRSIGIRILISNPEVACMQMQYRGPGDRFDVIKGLRPVYPITEISHNTVAKGLYTFSVNYQVRNKRLGSCAVPFNFGGGAVQFRRE